MTDTLFIKQRTHQLCIAVILMSTILLHRKIYTRVGGQRESVKTKKINSFLEKVERQAIIPFWYI